MVVTSLQLTVTSLAYLNILITTYTSSVCAAGLPQYQPEWKVGSTAVYAWISIFTIFFAVAPLFLASLSDITARLLFFVVADISCIASQLRSSSRTSLAGMLVTRALVGISWPFFSVVADSVIIFSEVALCGTSVGPMVSGIAAQHLTWLGDGSSLSKLYPVD